MRPLLIYVHGFKSSSQSQKAEEVRHHILSHSLPIDFLAPTFANYPQQSYQQLCQLIHEHKDVKSRQVALIGSSLGGFMATSVAQRMGLRAVLVNPAVHPYRLIGKALGEHLNPYTGERFVLDQSHLDELKAIELDHLDHPERLLVMLQTGDETLDYRDAQDYYKGCLQIVEQGGDHRFQHFDRHLPRLLTFLQLVQDP